MKNPLVWFGIGTIGLIAGSAGNLNGELSYCLQQKPNQKNCITAPGWFQAPESATQVRREWEASSWRLSGVILGVCGFAYALREARRAEEEEADDLLLSDIDRQTRIKEAEISQGAHLRSYTEVALRMAARRAFETLRMGARIQPVEQIVTNKTEDVQAQLPAVDSGRNAPEPQTADQGEKLSPVSTPNAETNSVSVQVETLGESLVEVLSSFGVKCHLVSAIQGPTFIRVSIKPAPGVAASSIVQRANDLQVQLNFAAVPIVSVQPGCIAIDVPRSDRQTVKFGDYIQPGNRSEKLTLPIGVNLQGQMIEADLSDPNTCHFLVGGTSGSGKSEWLRQAVFSLVTRCTPEQITIALVDPKRVTFPEFEEMPWLYSSICKDVEPTIALMEELVEEMESRYQLFEKVRVKDIQEYNQLVDKEPLPRIVCIFDEYADFMADRETKDKLESSIKRLGAKARAAGIHLILSTQRPDAKDVITPIIKANLPGRVALKTVDENNSKIVIDDELAARLLGKGDLLYRAAGPLQRLQALYASPSEIQSFLDNSTRTASTESTVPVTVSTTTDIDKLNQLVETSTDKFVAGLDKHYQVIIEYAATKNDWISASDVRNSRNHMKQFSTAQIQQFFTDLGGWGVGESQGGKYRYSSLQGT